MTTGGGDTDIFAKQNNPTPIKETTSSSGKQVLSSVVKKSQSEGKTKSLNNLRQSNESKTNNNRFNSTGNLSQSLTEFTLNLLEENRSSRTHGLFTLKMPFPVESNVSSNHSSSVGSSSSTSSLETDIDKSFMHFVAYVTRQTISDPFNHKNSIGSTMTEICMAFFLHCFIYLYDNGHKIPAQRFYLKNSSFVRAMLSESCQNGKKKLRMFRNEEITNILSSIESFCNKQNVSSELDQKLKSFSSHRTLVVLSEESLNTFMKFIDDSKDIVLSKIIHDFISTLDINKQIPIEKEKAKLPKVQDPDLFKELEESIKSLNTLSKGRMQDNLPAVTLYSISGANVISASSSFDHSAVAFSTDNKIEVSLVNKYSRRPTCEFSSDESPSIPKKQLIGHSGRVFGLSYLPFSDYNSYSSFLLSCSQDSTLRLWDVGSAHCRQTYNCGHVCSVWCQDISPLGIYFASGSRDTTAKLWTFDRETPLRIFAGHSMDVDAVKFHPNCKYLATGSSDRSVRLWSISDGSAVRMFVGGHRSGIFSLAFSPDGLYLASAGEDRRIRIWDMRTNRSVREYRGHTDMIKHLIFSSNGSLLVSSSLDGSVKIWDASLIKSSASSSSTDLSNGSVNPNVPVTSSPISSHSLSGNSGKILYSSFSHHTDNLLFSIGVK